MTRVIIIDERRGSLADDLSNAVVEFGDPANMNSINGKDGNDKSDCVIVTVTQEGVQVYEGGDAVESCTLARVKSEAETSMEKAQQQHGTKDFGDGVEPAHTVEERLRGVFSDVGGQGADDTGKQAGENFRW